MKISIICFSLFVIFFSSCKKSEEISPEIFSREYCLYVNQSKEVEGKDLAYQSWKSNNYFIASVKDAIITGNKVGKTNGYGGLVGRIDITVEPKITIYSEPLLYYNQKWENGRFTLPSYGENLLWGSAVFAGWSFIKQRIESSGCPWQVLSQSGSTLIYKTDNPASPAVAYLENDGILVATCIYVEYKYASQIADFINERFLVYSIDMSNYKSNFAYGNMPLEDKFNLEYVGQLEFSNEWVMIVYYGENDNSRGSKIDGEILDIFKNKANSIRNLLDLNQNKIDR